MTNRTFLLPLAGLLLTAAGLAQAAQSTFGHARAREMAALGKLPTASDIVVRDLVNYHKHVLPLPKAGEAVALEVRSDRGGARPGEAFFVQVGYTTHPEGDRALAPPVAVALVVDCSGSMRERGKMSQVHNGLRAFVERLRPDDQVAVVAFSSDARTVTPLRRRGDGRWLQDCIAQLQPGANTNLHAGLMRGIEELRTDDTGDDLGEMSRRVILLTDGIANTGQTNATAIAKETVRRTRGSIDVSTIGVGQNLDTALLGKLAHSNNGLFHFVADEQDVQKVFVTEADSLLVPAARQVELQIDVPRCLESVRVIGHKTKYDGRTLRISLPNLNAGVTGVVMLRCIMREQPERSRVTATVKARMLFDRTDAQGRETVRADTRLWSGNQPSSARSDVEVTKNAAIAVLAEGLKKMAKKADASRWSDADRVLQRGIDSARRIFPGNDKDLDRVRDIARSYSKSLKRYVDRFRNF